MVIGTLAQYPKPPSRPCFKMVLDTFEKPPPFSSMPCFDLVLDIGEQTPSSSVIPGFCSLVSCWYSISLKTQCFSTSYLCIHLLTLVYAYPFSPCSYVPIFSLLVLLSHIATSLHGLLPTNLFSHVFVHTTSLAGYVSTPLTSSGAAILSSLELKIIIGSGAIVMRGKVYSKENYLRSSARDAITVIVERIFKTCCLGHNCGEKMIGTLKRLIWGGGWTFQQPKLIIHF